jgi:putative ABC transport system permease protein
MLRDLLFRLRCLVRPRQVEMELDDELRFHMDKQIEKFVNSGMTLQEARCQARLAVGGIDQLKEECGEAHGVYLLQTLFRDACFGFRTLRKSPGFLVLSVLTLAIGIGTSTAIFSVVNPILFKSLPYPHADRVMMIWESRSDGPPLFVTYGTFHGIVERSHSFDAIAVAKPWQPTSIGGDRPERFEGQRVTPGYFRALGMLPTMGRDFHAADDRFRGARVVILSDTLWRRRFASDPNIVGQQVRLDDDLFTVVGIMPQSFENVMAPTAELWAPLQYDPSLPAEGREWGHHLRMVGRLRDGVDKEQARSELNVVLAGLAQTYAKGYDSSGGAPNGMVVRSLQSDLTKGVRPALIAVLGAVILVLLIACVNVTNLALARAIQRNGEFAMRAALGASRHRLLRQLLTESLLLAIVGGALGMVVANLGVSTLIALSPPGLPRVNAIHLDGAVFAFGFCLTTLVGILIGFYPALQASRSDLHTGMQQNSRRTTDSRRWIRRALVVSEVALALVLLVSAGLLLRSLKRLLSVDPGFDGSQLLTMQVQESGHRFDTAAARNHFFAEALDAVRHVPGVVSAGFTSQVPLSGDYDVYGAQFEKDNSSSGDGAFRYAVTPGMVETMRIPLRRGRLLDEHDNAGAPVAVLINESFAKQKFGTEDAIGQRLRLGPDAGHADRPWATIVGVVGDVKQESLAVGEQNAFYIPTTQWPWAENVLSLVVRTQGDAAALAPAVRSAIWSVDKDQPIVRVATMNSLLAASEAQRHFALVLFELFAVVGLILAAIGIYGVLSGSVTERTREIGVRAALGATRRDILSLVIGQGMTLAVLGVGIGLLGAIAASRTLVTLLFGVSQLDPITYLTVIVLLLGVAAVACGIPGWRATQVNPSITLRAE